MKNFYLIGMPGVGKSYWAEQIAIHYNIKSIDLDDIIIVKTGKTISQFFEQFGDAAFRKIEHETLHQIMQVFPANTIVACGGGTPCFSDNMGRMKANGKIIYLEATFDYLVKNLENENESRPLMQQPNWQQQLTDLYETRKSFYMQADFTFDATALSVKDFEAVLQ